MKRFFITGTDTNCGKTYVTCLLQQFFPKTLAIKPIASGCAILGDKLISEDAEFLKKNQDLPLDIINPWSFKTAVSPHIAATLENQVLSIQELVDYCHSLKKPGFERLLIEGAGGLMVPLVGESTWVDFLQLSQIPVILVVGMRLGCLNHALLTQTALIAHSIPCLGWIANCLDPNMLELQENIDTLKKAIISPLLGQVDFASGLKDFERLQEL